MVNADIARHKRDEASQNAKSDPDNAARHLAEAAEWQAEKEAAERADHYRARRR